MRWWSEHFSSHLAHKFDLLSPTSNNWPTNRFARLVLWIQTRLLHTICLCRKRQWLTENNFRCKDNGMDGWRQKNPSIRREKERERNQIKNAREWMLPISMAFNSRVCFVCVDKSERSSFNCPLFKYSSRSHCIQLPRTNGGANEWRRLGVFAD